jgi:hypothetical protein
MNAHNETPAQYEARKSTFFKSKARRATNSLRKSHEATMRRITYYNSPQGKAEREADNYATSVAKSHGIGCYCGCCMG